MRQDEAVKWRIDTLGQFRLINCETTQTVPLRSYRRVLIHLALHRQHSVPRRTLEADLYPEVGPAVAQNRLRVALSTLRRLLGDGLLETDEGLSLDPQVIAVDLASVDSGLGEAENSLDAADEAVALRSILPDLRKPLLPDFHDLWVIPFQSDWIHRATSTLRRLIRLENQLENWEGVQTAAIAILRHDPYDADAWIERVAAGGKLGLARRAFSEFASARTALRKSGSDFSEDAVRRVQGLREDLAAERDVASELSASVVELLGRTVAGLVLSDPREAGALFAIPGIRHAMLRHPHAAASVFDLLLDRLPDRDVGWCELAIQAVAAHVGMHRAERTIALSQDLLDCADDPQIRSKAYLYRAFALVQSRRYEEGLATLDAYALELERLPDEQAYHTLLSQRGTFLVQMARFGEAEACFARALPFQETHNDALGRERLAILRTNIAVMHLMRDDVESALPLLEAAHSSAKELGFDRILPLILPFAGYAWVRIGGQPEGVEAIIDGLKRAYRSGDTRAVQVGLDLACGAIAELGDTGLAVAALNWAGNWRKSCDHEWSPAERLFVDRILARPLRRQKPFKTSTEPKIVLHQVVKRLRALQQKGELPTSAGQ